MWPTYKLKYLEYGQEKTLELKMTFADFALTEARFRKHFRKVPRDAWNENMVVLSDFLEMNLEDREGLFPFIWTVDRKQQLNRVLVAKPIVESCEERRDFWIMLKSLAGIEEEEENVEQKIRTEIVGNISKGLMRLAGGEETDLAGMLTDVGLSEEAMNGSDSKDSYLAPWIETEECTSCDECTQLNGKIFAYNDDKKAYIKNPTGGPYEDLVKAAEKCTARVIHPGLPKDDKQKDIEKWINRAAKYN